MKKLFIFALAIFLMINLYCYEVNASESYAEVNMPEIIIADKYAESICSAKADNFFEGLENEKALKYSYFRYIGPQISKKLSKEMNKLILQQIKDKCFITNEEETEINDFLSMKKSEGGKN